MDGNFIPSLEVGELANQFHKPADGLGHLFMFPVEELEKHAERLIRILEIQGVSQETIHEEGSWRRNMFSNEGGSVDIHILDEILDIKRAVAIGRTLPENVFKVPRNGLLGMNITLKGGFSLKNFALMCYESGEMTEVDKKMTIGEMLRVIIEYTRNGVVSLNQDEFTKTIESWKAFNPDSPEKQLITYKKVFMDFIEQIVLYAEATNQVDNGRGELQNLIDQLNRNEDKIEGEMSYEMFRENLDLEGFGEGYDEYFVENQNHDDRYPSISHEDLFGKTIHKAAEVIRKPIIDEVIQKVAGVRKEVPLKAKLYGSTSM